VTLLHTKAGKGSRPGASNYLYSNSLNPGSASLFTDIYLEGFIIHRLWTPEIHHIYERVVTLYFLFLLPCRRGACKFSVCLSPKLKSLHLQGLHPIVFHQSTPIFFLQPLSEPLIPNHDPHPRSSPLFRTMVLKIQPTSVTQCQASQESPQSPSRLPGPTSGGLLQPDIPAPTPLKSMYQKSTTKTGLYL